MNRFIVVYVGRRYTGSTASVQSELTCIVWGIMEEMDVWRRMSTCVGGDDTSTFCA